MAFFHDDPSTLSSVLWYFVPKDRDVLPYPNSFGSRNWEIEDEPEPDIGERYSPRTWRGGLPEGSVPKNGKCGTAEAWANGVSIHAPIPPVFPGTNVPICCNLPIQSSDGGIKWGNIDTFGSCDDVQAAPATLHVTFQLLRGTTAPGIDGLRIPVFVQPLCSPGVYASNPFDCSSEPVTGTAQVFWACTGFVGTTFFYVGDTASSALCQNVEASWPQQIVDGNPLLGISDFKFLLDAPDTVIRAYLTL